HFLVRPLAKGLGDLKPAVLNATTKEGLEFCPDLPDILGRKCWFPGQPLRGGVGLPPLAMKAHTKVHWTQAYMREYLTARQRPSTEQSRCRVRTRSPKTYLRDPPTYSP